MLEHLLQHQTPTTLSHICEDTNYTAILKYMYTIKPASTAVYLYMYVQPGPYRVDNIGYNLVLIVKIIHVHVTQCMCACILYHHS